ncbi:MAG: DNA repair protein RadC [Marinilabiliaceae bacterium]|nr:DNA repair protein RadC [Marinilabiliaceae bacterium]
MNNNTERKQSRKILDLPEDDRPREKLINHGAESLTNAELLAIMIGSGIPGKSATDLAQELLDKYDNNLTQLARINVHELMQIGGIGKAKAAHIVATLEFGNRKSQYDAEHTIKKITSPHDAYKLLKPYMINYPEEHFRILMLDNNCNVLRNEELLKGGRDSIMIDIRSLFKQILLSNATRFIISHNHPSGNTKPSIQDEKITEKIREAAQTVSLKFDDHIIVGPRSFYSFANESEYQECNT